MITFKMNFVSNDHPVASCSKPLHVQRIEKATNLNLFLSNRQKEQCLPVCSSDEDDIIVVDDQTENYNILNGMVVYFRREHALNVIYF